MLVLMPKLPPISGGTTKRRRFSASPSARDQRVQDERPHEVGGYREHTSGRIVGGDHAVGFNRGRGILGIAEAFADHDVGPGESAIDVAVDDLAMARLVG